MQTSSDAVQDFDLMLEAYGRLAVTGALNLQRGQRLLVLGPLAHGGVSLEAAPLVRTIVAAAYDAGAPLVEVLWGDEALLRARFAQAPRDSFEASSRWLADVLAAHVDAGDAVLSVYANDPDLLKDAPPDLVSALQQATARSVRPFRERISRNATNWTVVAAAGAGWADKVFPGRPPAEQQACLWAEIARLCRLTHASPAEAWEQHLDRLANRRDVLNGRRYSALHFTNATTDLTVGLPAGHVWVSGRSETGRGTWFAPNLPTEEVFTMADATRVEGHVRSSKPLSYGGTLVEGFSLRFEGGRVVDVRADRGHDVLRALVATDDGAGRLGEVALVPHSSPVAQAGVLFYNTLFDENAASHVALGSAYRFTMEGGESMSDDAFERAGGNRSAIHVDFMIGSADTDVDGIGAGGSREPLMRGGEWVA